MSKQKVVVGLSGGVDSTAAALLLKEQGFEVTGAYLDVTGAAKDEAEANEIADMLGIKMVSNDVSKEFSESVIADFCLGYTEGRTPNPCVICNPDVKFKHLMKAADEAGADFIASGHYANALYDEGAGCYFIGKAANERKDQSYVLYRLNQAILSRLMLPLGNFSSKTEVRDVLKKRGFKNAGLRDSQEICFISSGTSYPDYIKTRGYPSKEGEFMDSGGKVIGVHKGIINYTVGQRKNLGASFGKPMFVVRIDQENNRVYLGGGEELFSREAISKFNFFPESGSGEMPERYDGVKVAAKARYTAEAAEAVIQRVDNNTVKTVFSNPQRALTPGQSIVFYIGEKVIGGGIILKT